MLARCCSKPIKNRVRERKSIIERLQGISLKSRLSLLCFALRCQNCFKLPKNIRPRTIRTALIGVRCALKICEVAKHDATHDLHYLASQVVVDSNFVEAQYELHQQFALFIDFFDKAHNWQVSFYRLIAFESVGIE